MKINLKILDASYLYGENEINSLTTKKNCSKDDAKASFNKSIKITS